ncbi:GNAT family N-acetyltransferase [Amycolatopsis lurida]|uniref:GNAT family N-acetyltransferase n=1 Tax=Amycolatopsis lurida TaxID=31959 RepID=UPI003661EF1E
MTNDLIVERFDTSVATESDFAAYHAVLAASQAVDRPGEPPLPLGELVARMRRPLPGMGAVAYWVARFDDEVVAFAEVNFLDEENSDIGLTDVRVHPAHRRRGIGVVILRALLPELKLQGLGVVEGWEVAEGTAGQAWAEALGFRPVRTIARQVLVVAEADRALWEVDVPDGYRLSQWVGSAPAGVVDSYAVARGAIHDAPLGESEYRWPEWTASRVRAYEAELQSQGLVQRVAAAIHETSGAVAGFTELCVHPRRPDWGYQRDTAVLASHRGNDLGRCLKAHMTRWVLADCPELDRISTTTGAENVHMIRVNRAVGYTTLPSLIAVQQELSSVEAMLGRRVEV